MVLEFITGIFYLFFDVFYWAKWILSVIAIHWWKKTHSRRFDLYDYDSEDEPQKMGVVIPEEEAVLESPFPEEHLQNASDEIFIYGINSKSESLVVRISRTCNDESEAWIYLKLSDGRSFTLEKTLGFQRNFGDKCTSFTCGGLQMYYLAPMRRWRIVYCGMLSERENDDKGESKSVFVKFTFLWSASSEVYDGSYDFDVNLTADGMARAKWNSFLPPVQSVSESMNFYSQSGVTFGLVNIEDEPEKELYLFGERMRNISKSESLVGSKFKHILGVVPESGLVVHLGKASIPNTYHNLYFGFIVHPNGLNYVIQDGHIISNLTGNDAKGKNLTVMFKRAGRRCHLSGNFVGNALRFSSEKGWNGHLELTGTEFEYEDLKGRGFMITGEISRLPQRKTVKKIPKLLSAARPLTVYFYDDVCQLTELTGGKGSSLGKLTKLSNEKKSLNFTVPKGIVVTTAAYEEFLTSKTIEQIEKLKNIAYGNEEGNIHDACKMASSAIEHAPMPDKIVKEIETKLNTLFDGSINQYKVAVRSSATGEDTDQMSAAGQMDTFLGVQGLNEILTAVKKCWASQFGYIAVQYKRQNAQILNSPMAVVIQEMVQCEAAGVLFTADPVTNNPSVTVITGNYGLGESVVSGSEEPDTVVLQKLPNDEIKVKSVSIGLKQHRIVMTDKKATAEDGTVTEDVPEEEKNKCCISEEMALRLGKLAFEIENYFKSPRDIEWGIKQNSIYILQSRPITTGGAISDYEIKHEFDIPLRSENEFFTLANVGEVMPGSTSPLGIDVICKFFSLAFQKSYMKKNQRNACFLAKYFPIGVGTFYNHEFLTVDWITRIGDCESVLAQSIMIGIFGRVLDDPDLIATLKRKKYLPVNKIRSIYTLVKNLFFCGRGIDKIREVVFNYKIPALKGKTSEEIFNLLTRSMNHHALPCSTHITCSEMSSLWNMTMFLILKNAKGCVDNDVYYDFAKLLSSSSNIESADVPSAMQKLAQSLFEHVRRDIFRSLPAEAALKRITVSDSIPGELFREFMKRHGHRCLKEFDMHSIPWNTDARPLIKLLQNMSGSSRETKHAEEESFSKLVTQLKVPLDFKSRLYLRFVLPNCRRGVREREACKANFMKALDNTRKGFQHLSKAMVAEGYLPDTDLMYFLTIDEIKELLETRNPRLITRAIQRRKLDPILEAYMFDEITKGRPIPINERLDEEEIEYVADLTMKGIPVSHGKVRGYVRVALTLEEAANLKPGEILITHSTDIAWSPYFPVIAGVVTELGGLISHGAVVSREYGIPCLVGLHGATKHFRTGDYVFLDGSKGILQRLPTPEN